MQVWRPHHHPNAHTTGELKFIKDMRRRNPDLGLTELRHRLKKRDYTRRPESLYRIEDATSGWMEANAGQVKYTGGREIKIPTLSTDGLGDYDRSSGYPRGKVSVTYQAKTMTQDRGIQFLLDRIDADESGFIANAAAAMSAFQSENVIPR